MTEKRKTVSKSALYFLLQETATFRENLKNHAWKSLSEDSLANDVEAFYKRVGYLLADAYKIGIINATLLKEKGGWIGSHSAVKCVGQRVIITDDLQNKAFDPQLPDLTSIRIHFDNLAKYIQKRANRTLAMEQPALQGHRERKIRLSMLHAADFAAPYGQTEWQPAILEEVAATLEAV